METEHELSDGEDDSLFSGYGEFVLLLDADPVALREAIRDASQDQKRRIIGVLEDQLNETPIKGNKELFEHHLYLWMFTIRQLDEGPADQSDVDNFRLNYTEWEYNQFY